MVLGEFIYNNLSTTIRQQQFIYNNSSTYTIHLHIQFIYNKSSTYTVCLQQLIKSSHAINTISQTRKMQKELLSLNKQLYTSFFLMIKLPICFSYKHQQQVSTKTTFNFKILSVQAIILSISFEALKERTVVRISVLRSP